MFNYLVLLIVVSYFASSNNNNMIYNPFQLAVKQAKDRAKNKSLEALREQYNIGGLNKSHKVQRLANSIEAVYFQKTLICMKSNRADNHRNERRAKR